MSDANRRVILIVAASVVFILLCVGALFAGAARGASQLAAESTPTASQTSAPVPTATATRVAPDTVPTPDALASCSIATAAKDTKLATFSADVTDAATGEVLFSRNGTTAVATGAAQQLETAAAAIKVLGPDYRLTTTVVAGPDPGSVVLVGGGDPTLSRTAAGAQSVYADAPKLSDLAAQTIAVMAGVPITKILLDSTYYSSKDAWDASWSTSLRTGGQLSKVTALQVDGDRANPAKQVSPRSADPVMAAGTYFAQALGVPNADIELGTAPAAAQQLGSVQSQPMSTLVPTMVLTGDATLAEAIARVVSKESGGDGSAASLQKTITAALTAQGLSTSGVVVRDGSGSSAKDVASPRFVTKLVRAFRAGKNGLTTVYNSLSVAGQTGVLEKRFSGDNQVAQGNVVGVAGTLPGDYSLAGVITAKDNSELAFSFTATGSAAASATATALDTLATAVYNCGTNLTSH